MASKRRPSPEFVGNPFVKRRNLQWSIELPSLSPTRAAATQDHDRPRASPSLALSETGNPVPAPAATLVITEAEAETGAKAQTEPETKAETLTGTEAAAAPRAQISAAAVEDGTVQITDHAAYFGSLLAKATLVPFPDDTPRLSTQQYRHLFAACSGNKAGAHFVIHQHDHPGAGLHYDLRLQINETSSASWAIMYGLPGDPNSARLNRNATET